MNNHQRLNLAGRRYVLVEERDYERLCQHAAREVEADDLPRLPKPDRRGRVPAVQYARISLARDLIRNRKSVGLTQQQLADLAGIRQETLSRLEAGKHSATVRTVERITEAIENERQRRQRRRSA